MTFPFAVSYAGLWILVGIDTVLLLVVLLKLVELNQRLESQARETGLPAGSVAPEFTAVRIRSEAGEIVTRWPRENGSGVLLFLSPTCSVCDRLADSIRESAANPVPQLIAVCQGEEAACRRLMVRLGPETPLLFVQGEDVAGRYHVVNLPTAVVVDREGRIRDYSHPKSAEDLRVLAAGRDHGSRGPTEAEVLYAEAKESS